jgi:Outer membrane protein and related peptidoglycan-associated (lipo)proteins
MIHFIIIILLSLSYCGVSLAQNLIPNPSFEDENICTEYDKNCAPEAWIATSLMANYYFDQTNRAFDRRHFVGLTAGSVRTPGARNFIRTKLLCGMQKGKQYRLSFYTNSPQVPLDSIGIYFSESDYLFEKRKFTQLKPQLWSADGLDSPRRQHNEWQRVELIYTADGNENYITLGHFRRVDLPGPFRAEYRYEYYIFIDSIALLPMDPKEKICAEADSVRREIYSENPRHNMLQKWVYYYTKNPPKPIKLPATRVEVTRRIDTLIIPDIFFATASFELSPKSFSVLDSFANRLKAYEIDSMVIEGHTDSIGTLEYNEKLSVNRAASVKDYLAQQVPGVQEKTVWRGFAFLRPAASNKTPQGRQQNRRVEIYVYRRE